MRGLAASWPREGMTMKIHDGNNGHYVTFERSGPWWIVQLRSATALLDKVRCDEYRDACTYRKAFLKIARAN